MTAAPSGRLCGGDGAVEGPRHGEGRVIVDPFQRCVGLREREAAGGVAPVVSCLLPRRSLLLRNNGPRARGTCDIAASEVV